MCPSPQHQDQVAEKWHDFGEMYMCSLDQSIKESQRRDIGMDMPRVSGPTKMIFFPKVQFISTRPKTTVALPCQEGRNCYDSMGNLGSCFDLLKGRNAVVPWYIIDS